MIYYLPLEHLDKRYTKDLDILLERELQRQGKEYIKIEGQPLLGEIKTGAFLDANSTSHYKFSQLQEVSRLFMEKVKNGDTFFISDLWFPGLEALPYMAFFNRLKVSIKGFLHAGSFTETDYVASLADWARPIEMGWLRFIDQVFVGSDWIKSELISKGYITKYGTLFNTGLPFNPQQCYDLVPAKPWSEKEDIVTFAGRLDDEKQPWLFDRLADLIPGAKYIKTMAKGYSKKEYYEALSRSKVFFSAALQENFGYAALEACSYGCNLVVPNRLSYLEKYPSRYRYNSYEEAVEKVRAFLSEDNSVELTGIALAQVKNAERVINYL